VEETVHVPPKIDKYDAQTGNQEANKTPKESIKKSNTRKEDDGYESPYSSPRGIYSLLLFSYFLFNLTFSF
jgi:hypothetical protein